MLAQPVVGAVFEKQPHFSGSELFGWAATVEPVAEALLQRWTHSDGSGAMSLTGGFKAWRSSTLAAVPFDGVHAGGYVFQIEMTFRASRAGARVREIPITFRDRRVGQSKMSRRIVVEALVVVVQLRLEDLRSRWRGSRQPK